MKNCRAEAKRTEKREWLQEKKSRTNRKYQLLRCEEKKNQKLTLSLKEMETKYAI